MRIGITGAGGLLGGAVLRRLLDARYEIVALSGSLEAGSGFDVARWDASWSYADTAKVLRDVDVVVHMGAYIPRDHKDVSEAARCVEVNALGTLNLLRACESVEIRKFIYVSGANALRPRAELVREDDPVGCEYSPCYLGSKVLGEIYCKAAMARGLDVLIVRPSSIYGIGMHTGAIWNFSERLRAGLPISLQNGGQFRADYIWREDVAQVLVDAIAGQQKGEVNLGSGQTSSLLDIAKLLVQIFDADPDLVKLEAIGSQVTVPGFAAVDISRAREWFGFSPLSIRDGLTRWFKLGER